MLVRNKLNIAGETHTESDLRRDEERRFCLAKTGSADYWTEAEFPDLYEGKTQPALGDPAADLMEFRATHGVAILISAFDELGDEGVTVAATPAASAAALLSAFDAKVQKLITARERVDRSWRPSTPKVDSVVRNAHAKIESAYQAYEAKFRNAPTQQQLTAVRDFANGRVELRDLVPELADAVGAKLKDRRDGTELARYMRTQRSNFMGLGAVFSKRVGVWKVGDLHIQDLLDGTSKVDSSRINIITKGEFNQELDAWRQG